MLIIGHRGAAALAPENTLRALREGMKCADYVEVDIRLSGDGVPVVIHDATLERTTTGAGPVRAYTLRELRELDAGEGEKIPTLEEVLELTGGRTGLVVELKETEGVERIGTAIKESGMEKVIIVSFHAAALKRARAVLPAPCGLICSRSPEDAVKDALRIPAEYLLLKHTLLNTGMVKQAHENGLKLIPWTPNTTADMQRVIDMGVDGFATDDPCLAREIVGKGE